MQYKASISSNEGSSDINDYDVIFYAKKLGFTSKELNLMKFSDLLSILLLTNPEETVKQATQEDFDRF